MIGLSIKRKIIAIALILIVLMTVAALLSMALVMQVSARLEDLTQSYVPAYAALARANIHSLTRAIALRRILIEKERSPVDAAQLAATVNDFRAEGEAVDSELKAARKLIDGLIEKGSHFGDTTRMVQLGNRLSDLIDDTRGHLNEEIARLLPLLDGSDQKAVADGIQRVEALRDELDHQLDTVRHEMVSLLKAEFGGDRAQAAYCFACRHPADGARRGSGSGLLGHRQHRIDTPGAPAAGGRSRGRGRQSK